jgi:crossover junction endodeoxyribonuclease RusA
VILGHPVATVATFTVHGIPQPQGSLVRNSANPGLKPWRQDLVDVATEAWADRDPLTGPVEVVATFTFPRLRSHYGTGRNSGTLKPSAPLAHTTKPDLDKLQRALGDALTLAGVLRDDSLICSWVVSKTYGQTPGAHISLVLLNPL